MEKSGRILCCVRPENYAWHAGTTAATGRSPYWQRHNANTQTIGIEVEGFAGRGDFTPAQLDACERLAVGLTRKY